MTPMETLVPADSLDDVYKTLSPLPLTTGPQLDAFYTNLEGVRGESLVDRLKLDLIRAHGGLHFKAFLMGHQGVGKSTELRRLEREMQSKYKIVRINAVRDFNPGNIKPYDILLVMLMSLAGHPEIRQPSGELIDEIWRWFAAEQTITTRRTAQTASAEAGIGVEAGSLWASLLKVFGRLKGEIQIAAERKTEIVEYRLSKLSDLLSLLNRFFEESTAAMKQQGHEWLFIGEDFDRLLDPGLPHQLFVDYGNMFAELNIHFIFTIPVSLGYSAHGRLRFPVRLIPDTPVYTSMHEPHQEGRRAVREVLKRRMSDGLFEPGQKERLIVASGGRLRTLFDLVRDAADRALLAKPARARISEADADAAVNQLRLRYTRRLGDSLTGTEDLTWEDKARKLLDVYGRDAEASAPDAVCHALLGAGAIQEFNGAGRYGVHPIVVDILKLQGKLSSDAPGGTS